MSQIEINNNINNVNVENTINTVDVDNSNGNVVIVPQEIVTIVEINTPGPQGPPGPSGSFPNTGSFVTTSSFNEWTGSASSQFAGTASFAISSSYATQALSASWAPTQNIDTGSLVTTSSFNAFTSSYNTGSFTGSFTGSLLGTASFATQALSASFAISSSFATTASFVTTAQTASFVTGSNVFGPFGSNSVISASFAVSSSRALTASHADNTSGISSSITNNVDNYLLTATGGSTINGESNLTFDGVLLSLGQTEAGRFKQGGTTSANGTGSHAEGQSTGANGEFSHAEGRRTTANGNYSHTEGYETISSGAYQHVQGQFNIPLPDESAFIIGNGIDGDNRSNLVLASGSEFQVTGSVRTTSGFILKDYTQPNYGVMAMAENSEYAALAFRSYDETGEFGTAQLSIDAETNIGIESYSEDGSRNSSIIITHGDIALTNLTDSSGTSIGSRVQLWKDSILLTINNNDTGEENTLTIQTDRTYTTKYIETDEGFIGNYLEAPSITGSLFGTASYATQALSASFAISSSRAISSSFATTASFVTTAQTASFVTGSNVFGPFGSNSVISASFAVSSSRAISSSFATSASLAINSDNIGITDNPSYGGVTYYPTFVSNTSGYTSAFVDSSVFTYNPNTNILTTTASFAISSSFATTASFAISASWAPTQNIDTGSLVTTSSFNAFTSSYNTGSFTGSFTGSLFGTASFAQTASYAPNYIEKSVGPTYTTNTILTVTQAEYDAIDPKDSTTLYFIV
jgi:trimeric autotransporter adhesin